MGRAFRVRRGSGDRRAVRRRPSNLDTEWWRIQRTAGLAVSAPGALPLGPSPMAIGFTASEHVVPRQHCPWSEPRGHASLRATSVLLGLAAAIATGLVHALGLAVSRVGLDRIDLVSTRLLLDVARGVHAGHPAGRPGARPPRPNDSQAVGARRCRRLLLRPSARSGSCCRTTAISRAAALVLAAGIGTTVSRMVMKRSDRWLSWSRRLVVGRTCRRCPAAALVAELPGPPRLQRSTIRRRRTSRRTSCSS